MFHVEHMCVFNHESSPGRQVGVYAGNSCEASATDTVEYADPLFSTYQSVRQYSVGFHLTKITAEPVFERIELIRCQYGLFLFFGQYREAFRNGGGEAQYLIHIILELGWMSGF